MAKFKVPLVAVVKALATFLPPDAPPSSNPAAMICVATCLSGLIKEPAPDNIVPSLFDKRVVETVAFTIQQSGVCVCKY